MEELIEIKLNEKELNEIQLELKKLVSNFILKTKHFAYENDYIYSKECWLNSWEKIGYVTYDDKINIKTNKSDVFLIRDLFNQFIKHHKIK